MSGVSNHYDSLIAMQALIQSLITAGTLTSMDKPPIVQEVLKYDIEAKGLPVILIAPYGPEKINEGPANLLQLDSIGYGIAIAFVADADNGAIPMETRLGWKQAVRRMTNNADLAVNSTSYQMTCHPAPAIDAESWRGGKWVSGMLVYCFFEERRTTP